MKVVIMGNGLAGTMAAKTLRELDASVEIDVFAEERYPYYPRPNLIEFIAGNLPYERLFAFPEGWNTRQRISLHLGDPVVNIDLQARTVESRNGESAVFDKLLLAGGSAPLVLPVHGAEKRGLFVLRTLDDALAILEFIKDHPRVAILGGGLLGLEIARALRVKGAAVMVCEVFDRLLPRQLDPRGAERLKAQIDKMGIEVRLGVTTDEITGDHQVKGLRFNNGTEEAADMIIMAAGIRPNISLAAECRLAVNRGVVVNDFLQTSHPDVYAAGDVAQHRNVVYGIIPASFDQARAAAFNILGQEKRYDGTIPSNTLKIVGISVTSCGLVNPEGEEFEVLVKEKKDEGIYKKLVLQNGALVGAIWMGTKKGAAEIARLVSSGAKVDHWKSSLLEDDFDFVNM